MGQDDALIALEQLDTKAKIESERYDVWTFFPNVSDRNEVQNLCLTELTDMLTRASIAVAKMHQAHC